MYMNYELNKGIGESAEFKGLKAQYLFIFVGGLLALFVLFVILYMAGMNQWFCIAFGVISASVLVRLTFLLRFADRMDDLPPECPVRGTRTDEAAGQETASPLPDQPDQSPETIHD